MKSMEDQEVLKLKRGDIVKVIWDDAHSAQGWIADHDVEHFINNPLSRCIHVGLFVAQTEKALILTFGMSEHGTIDGTIEIPPSCIIEMKVLEESEVEKI
jgi:hypothetical protein